MGDMDPFRHGEEGTHICCKRRIDEEGGKATCCVCNPHKNCVLNIPVCPVPKCYNIRASRGRRKDNPGPDEDQFRRFSYCTPHRKGKKKAERLAWRASQ